LPTAKACWTWVWALFLSLKMFFLPLPHWQSLKKQ
jgi:hypothetical protein